METTYRLRTPKTGLGEGGGRGKRKSVDSHIIKLSEEDLGKFKENYPNVKRIKTLPRNRMKEIAL